MISKQPAETLYIQMKQDIRDNKLPLGTPLKQEQLSNQYGVSRIPIRDVLQRLKNEGWLITSGKRGAMVNPLNATEAEDLYLMRSHLEPLILGYAMTHLNHQIIGKATDILEQLEQPGLTIQTHGELNWQFHGVLYQAANRPTLFNNINNLHQLCSRYIGFQNMELNYQKNSQKEHYQLLNALQKKQLGQAQQILKQHISQAGKNLVAYLNNHM
ncbi:GntR family transcriptional regulator [uncultured Paraglaciecola sp.]|uniref:GntR family transcriptional regulator n=1 Tax=uncultured Paraglaciecola sp. TaxID=1765024 RepID=UPI0025929E4C|nr:GntR family transcriptional regulator [uncultured Paraglaciecola sp.]